MTTSTAAPAQPTKKPTSSVPSPAALAAYGEIDSQLPAVIVDAAVRYDRQAFAYAMTGMVIGGLIASVIAGFVYLVISSHPEAAGGLLGASVLSMIAGFRSSRL